MPRDAASAGVHPTARALAEAAEAMGFRNSEVEELLVATGRECCICHRRHAVEVHHIVRHADGGTDDVDNAIPLCPNCHDQVHGSAALGRTTRKYTPGELCRFREAQKEAVCRRRNPPAPDGPPATPGPAIARGDVGEGVGGSAEPAAEPGVDASDTLPDYLMDLGQMKERIRDLRERVGVLREVGLSQAAEPLSDEIARLTEWLPLVEAGYPLMDDFRWQLTREACALCEYHIDLTSDAGEVPDGVLRTWCDVRRSGVFDDLEVWGYGVPCDDDTPLADLGGYVVGVARGRRFWVTGW